MVILAILIWYLTGHWGELKALVKLKPVHLIALYALWPIGVLGNTRVIQIFLNALEKKTGLAEMFKLNNAALLLNYAPMKLGTVFRANYLKRHYGLAYTQFATCFLYITFLMAACAAMVGLLAILSFFSIESHESKMLAAIFGAVLAGSLVFLLVPLPLPAGKGRFAETMRNFLSSRRTISKHPGAILQACGFLIVNCILTASRLWIIYQSMDQNVHPAGCLVLGAIGFVALFVGLTPGSLGIRELLLGGGAVAIGIPLEVGLLAAMIDRGITLLYVFSIGSICAISIWRKSPADLKSDTAEQ